MLHYSKVIRLGQTQLSDIIIIYLKKKEAISLAYDNCFSLLIICYDVTQT